MLNGKFDGAHCGPKADVRSAQVYVSTCQLSWPKISSGGKSITYTLQGPPTPEPRSPDFAIIVAAHLLPPASMHSTNSEVFVLSIGLSFVPFASSSSFFTFQNSSQHAPILI